MTDINVMDVEFRNAALAALSGKPEKLSEMIRSKPLCEAEREFLADIISLMSHPRKAGRPSGSLHMSETKIAAVLEYNDRLHEFGRSQTDEEIRIDIATPLGVSEKTLQAWATEFNKERQAIDKWLDKQRKNGVEVRSDIDGYSLLRTNVSPNPKKTD